MVSLLLRKEGARSTDHGLCPHPINKGKCKQKAGTFWVGPPAGEEDSLKMGVCSCHLVYLPVYLVSIWCLLSSPVRYTESCANCIMLSFTFGVCSRYTTACKTSHIYVARVTHPVPSNYLYTFEYGELQRDSLMLR